jgi:tRNA (cmo5U34)-methyltransferase
MAPSRDEVPVWNPDTYLEAMLAEIPAFRELQERTAAATAVVEADAMLELGVGTGETARRVRARHPNASLTAIDSSEDMLRRARAAFPEADLRLARLEDPLPEGPFDLVYSTLVVHHLDSDHKRDLFRRIAASLRPNGLFVLADVVVPEDPANQQIPIDWEMDLPDGLSDQLAWLQESGFDARAFWTHKDLAILRARRPR